MRDDAMMSSRPVRPVEAPAAGRLALAAMLAKADAAIECEVAGGSMLPTIPPGSILRIRPNRGAVPSRGDVIAVAIRDRIIAHRVVRADAGTGHLLTRGDADLLPDPPVPREWVLGRAVEVRVDGTWQPIPPAPRIPAARTAAAALATGLVAATMALSLSLADRIAHAMIRAARRPALSGVTGLRPAP